MDYQEVLLKSLNKWRKKIGIDELKNFAEEIQCNLDSKELSAILLESTTNLMLSATQPKYFELLERLFQACESEIENIMLCALIMVGSDKVRNVSFMIKGNEYNKEENVFDEIIIEPQVIIGKYRIDFRVKYKEITPDFDNEIEYNGKKIPGTKIIEKELLIECDGHDFHEKTKEQAMKDRKKDRILQSLGFKIFRFTGSEIYNDPINCADEAIKEFCPEITLKNIDLFK
jgi:very-short-patch-repair endonuclease